MSRWHFGWVAALVAAQMCGCSSMPPGADYPKRASVVFAHPEETQLGREFDPPADLPADEGALRILSVGVDGFAARLQLIDAAEQALDLQYFIFRQDETGRLLTEALLRAADRGVSLRILVDDAERKRGDSQIRLLTAHPQVEVRVFNPFRYRGDSSVLRGAEFLANHGRLDYRMHNKLFVADGAIALIGGRNIGNEYFQVDPEGQFADDDVFVNGPLVKRLADRFDEYWNSPEAIPVEALAGGRPSETELAKYRAQLQQQKQLTEAADPPYLKRAASGDPVAAILRGQTPLVWAHAQVVCDSPEKKKVEKGSMVGSLMYQPVARAASTVKTELLMVSPYLVPTPQELQLLKELRQRGVSVRILTNSLASNTELAAQAGYAHHRKALLQMGVELYELRAQPESPRGTGQSAHMSQYGHLGLHGKLFVFDGQKLYIGSMNFDQRSTHLNTEIGLIVDNPELGRQTAERFRAMTQLSNAYQVVLRPDGSLLWRTQEHGQLLESTHEPSRGFWRTFAVHLLGLLPIEGEL
jgi:putative cardiolipin synthase